MRYLASLAFEEYKLIATGHHEPDLESSSHRDPDAVKFLPYSQHASECSRGQRGPSSPVHSGGGFRLAHTLRTERLAGNAFVMLAFYRGKTILSTKFTFTATTSLPSGA